MKIALGTVAINKAGIPYTGINYTAGAKVYKTENIAKSAVRNHKDLQGNPIEYTFHIAYVDKD